ncbi:MAG: type II secretion system F family protein [Parachlamydiaceae bacterium]
MPLYQYQAVDSKGKRKQGLIEAQGEREAKDKLREMNVIIIRLGLKKGMSSRQSLKGDKLLAFTLQLSQLVGAGVPLYESLTAIEEQCRNEPYHRIILSLCEQIKAGSPLSQAMGAYPESFNKLYCSMITAGEAVGALDVVLEKLAILLTKQIKLRSDIVTAMVYPGILASFSFFIIIILLTFVVPSIEGIFAERKLNGFTQLVLSVSHFLSGYWWLYIPVIGGAVTYSVFKLRSPEGKIWLERNLLKLPLIRTLMIQAAVSRFCRTMGTLLLGGLPLIESLRISRDVMRNVAMAEEIQYAEGRIIEGSSLGKELSRAKLFPPMVAQMLSVGEDSGSVVVMFNKIADMYEQDLEKTLNRLMALAQPAILIIMGAVIGTILLAILLPLTDISSLAV